MILKQIFRNVTCFHPWSKISPVNGTLLNEVLHPKLLSNPLAYWLLENLKVFLPQIA